MIKLNELKTKAKNTVIDFKDHWHTPKEGDYVSNKEAVMLYLGGSGAAGISNILTYISFAASSFLVGAVYGISFNDIYIIGLIGILFTFIFSPITMIVQDNFGRPPKKTMRIINIVCIISALLGIASLFIPEANTEKIVPAFPQILATNFLYNVFNVYYHVFMFRVLSKKFGKFRPWVVVGSIPTVVCILLLGFLPMNDWAYSTKLWVINLIFAFYNLFLNFSNQKANIMNVMTPNTNERTKLRTWECFIAGALGGLIMVIFPFVADFFGGMSSLTTYRYIVPAGVLLCTPLVLLQAFCLKERVIVEESHKPSIGMFKGYKEVLRNKYFWILNISNFLDNIQSGSIAILNVMVVYALRQDYILGALTGVSGCFATIALPFVPRAIRKFGKKKTYIVSSLLQLISFGIQLLGIYTNSVVVLFIGIGSVNFFNIFSCMSKDLMTPDIWDYQQYISGERLESSAGIFGVLFTPLSKVLALTVPAVYGLVGFTSEWNVLYFDDTRNKVFLYTVLLLAVAKVITTIPYFFYDLSEAKHEKIIEELKIRAGQTKEPTLAPTEAQAVAE